MKTSSLTSMRLSVDESWFADSPFNMLIDYYPEVSPRPYGSGATRENILPVLRDLDLGFVIVYAKGHGGRTTFNSRLDTAHPQLAKEMPVFFRELTRETSTKLFFYYSGLIDGVAAMRNPDWRMRDQAGNPARFFEEWLDWFNAFPICPLSPYFDEWVTVHFQELFASADPDGIWMDGDWSGPCYCQRCETRFRAETGFDGPMPKSRDLVAPGGLEWSRWWTEIVDEWWGKVAGLIKSLKPDCLYSSGNGSARTEFSTRFDWRSGDFATPYNHRLRQSIMMRRYTTQHLPYDSMTVDATYIPSRPHLRSRTKTVERMLQEGAGVLANGGQWCYWTYPLPNGALIPSKMKRAREAAAFTRERRDIFVHTKSAQWTAVLDADPPASLPGTASLPGDNVFGAAKALIALHRSPDVMDESAVSSDMPYDLLIMPEQTDLRPETIACIVTWVERGGKLISSGASLTRPEMQELLGISVTHSGALPEGHVLLGDGDPAGIRAPWDQVEPVTANALYPLYRSWDDDNPDLGRLMPCYPIDGLLDEEAPTDAGFPAATIRQVGAGTVIHIPTDLFTTYWRTGDPPILGWVRELVDRLQPEPLFRTDARSFVEISLRQKADMLLVHVINGSSGRDLSQVDTDDLWVADIPSIGPISFAIRCAAPPTDVRWQPGDLPADTTWIDGTLHVTLPHLDIHTCLTIRPWPTST